MIAVDPGTTESAYVEWDGKTILRKGKIENYNLKDLLEIEVDQSFAIEEIVSYGMPVGKTTLDTCVWIGRFIEAAQSNNGTVDLIPRKDAKIFVCNDGRAKDGSVRQGLIDMVGEQGTKKAPGPTHGCSKDVWSALAIAVTWWSEHVDNHK